MPLSSLLIFATALFVNAGSPGPSVAALVARVINSGARSVLPFLVAMWLGEVGWLLAAILGLGLIAQKFMLVLTVIKFLGVAYLLYLAWQMWNKPTTTSSDDIPSADSSMKLFATGLALTVGNPKIVLFYMALLPALIPLDHVSTLDAFKLALTCLAVMALTDLSWMTAASWARQMLKSPRAVRLANRTGAAAMGGAALAIATR